MDFLVIITIALIISIGILLLTPDTARLAAQAYRLAPERKMDAKVLRDVFLKGVNSAGRLAAGIRTSRKNEQIQREIYSALSVLRNYASAESVTTDYLFEQFSQTNGILKDVYSGALRLLRTGRKTEAAEYFSAAANTPFARDFIMLILDWDIISQGKQKQTIVAFQNALKETRTTELMRKNEVMSDLVYLPVVAGVLIIFVNFVYVAYFAEQSALLRELFF